MKRLLYVAGAALIGWGGYGLFTTTRHPLPLRWLKFFLGAQLGNDLLVIPVAIAVGAVVARVMAPRWRPYIVSGLIITGAIGIIAYPLIGGYGLRGDNPSIQPLDYPRGLLITLASVWAGIVVTAVVRERLRRGGAGTAGSGPRPAAAADGPGRTTPAAPADR